MSTGVAARLVRAARATSTGFGHLAALLVVVLVILIAYDVVMRYLFNSGSVALQELEWHLFSLIFLLGAAATLAGDGHVRVDVLYRSNYLTDKQRRLLDLAGHVLFLLPFCLLVIWSSIPFVVDAWRFAEHSPDPGGLPFRFLVKATIPLGFGLVALQALAQIVETVAHLRGEPASTN